jgi:hypothetical protein
MDGRPWLGLVPTQTSGLRDTPILESLSSIPHYELQLTCRTGLWLVRKITFERMSGCHGALTGWNGAFPVAGRTTFGVQLLFFSG